jgi:hypothetical protein
MGLLAVKKRSVQPKIDGRLLPQAPVRFLRIIPNQVLHQSLIEIIQVIEPVLVVVDILFLHSPIETLDESVALQKQAN